MTWWGRIPRGRQTGVGGVCTAPRFKTKQWRFCFGGLCSQRCTEAAATVFFFFFSAEAETVFFLSLRPLYVTVVYQGKYSHCMRIGVAVPLNSTVYRLRDAVSRETKIPMDQVLFPSLSDSASDTLWGCVTAAQCYCRTPVYPGGAACNPFPPRISSRTMRHVSTHLSCAAATSQCC